MIAQRQWESEKGAGLLKRGMWLLVRAKRVHAQAGRKSIKHKNTKCHEAASATPANHPPAHPLPISTALLFSAHLFRDKLYLCALSFARFVLPSGCQSDN